MLTSVIIYNLIIAEAMPRAELPLKKDNNNNNNNGLVVTLTPGCKMNQSLLTIKPGHKKDQLTRWGNAGAYSMFYVNEQAKMHNQIRKQQAIDKIRAKYCSMPQTTRKPIITRPTKPIPLGPIAVPFFSSYGWGPMG